jgi:hypothetical protein
MTVAGADWLGTRTGGAAAKDHCNGGPTVTSITARLEGAQLRECGLTRVGRVSLAKAGRAPTLNPGPLAPQARNINYLQAPFTENARLSSPKIGRQLDANARNVAFGLQLDSTPDWTFLCSYARLSRPCFRRLEMTTKLFLYIGWPPTADAGVEGTGSPIPSPYAQVRESPARRRFHREHHMARIREVRSE